jgi:hypothetical protein
MKTRPKKRVFLFYVNKYLLKILVFVLRSF